MTLVWRDRRGWWAAALAGGAVLRLSLPRPSARAAAATVAGAPGPTLRGAAAARHPLARAIARYLGGGPPPAGSVRAEGTAFARRVWAAARRIPRGETRTYGEIARAVGAPGAARAVGRAMGANPVPILIPCHRVVAATGLGGFASGPAWKRRLLALDRMTAP